MKMFFPLNFHRGEGNDLMTNTSLAQRRFHVNNIEKDKVEIK